MVTVKRKINSETDKYGGYSNMEIKAPSAEIEIKTPDNVGDSFMQAQYKKAEAHRNIQATQELPQRIQRQDQNENVTASNRPTAVYMPVIRPKKEAEVEEEKVQTVAEHKKLDGKTKLILGIYAALIVFLSALVIATGIILSSTGSRVEELQSELAAKNAIVAEQLGEITLLSDDDALTGRAYNSGMEKIENQGTLELLPIGEVKTYEGSTNWFDSFCDWLNGVFGG